MAWINHKQQRPHDAQVVLIYYAYSILGKAVSPTLRVATYWEAVDAYDWDGGQDEDIRPGSDIAYLFWRPKPDPPSREEIEQATK